MKHYVDFGGVDGGEITVDAYIPVADEAGKFTRVLFDRRDISRLIAFNDTVSGIVLRDGVTIPVILPMDDLFARTRLSSADADGRIDLRPVTGYAVTAFQKLSLSKDFNPIAEIEQGDIPFDFRIRLFARLKQNLDLGFHLIEFNFRDVKLFEPNRQRKELETFVKLRAPLPGLGWTEFYFDMPLNDFQSWIKYAVNGEHSLIDMSSKTSVSKVEKLII